MKPWRFLTINRVNLCDTGGGHRMCGLTGEVDCLDWVCVQYLFQTPNIREHT